MKLTLCFLALLLPVLAQDIQVNLTTTTMQQERWDVSGSAKDYTDCSVENGQTYVYWMTTHLATEEESIATDYIAIAIPKDKQKHCVALTWVPSPQSNTLFQTVHRTQSAISPTGLTAKVVIGASQ